MMTLVMLTQGFARVCSGMFNNTRSSHATVLLATRAIMICVLGLYSGRRALISTKGLAVIA
eukprot:7681376-Alexandrium_andersonii.AAC.1